MYKEKIQLKPLTVETLKKLIQKAKEYELKYLLFLEERHANGVLFEVRKKFKVIRGRVKKVLLERYRNDGSPSEFRVKYMVIPLTVPVIIVEESYEDFNGEITHTKTLYVFTTDGWKYVIIQ